MSTYLLTYLLTYKYHNYMHELTKTVVIHVKRIDREINQSPTL